MLQDIWVTRGRLRFNRGIQRRASGYFSSAHLAQLDRMMFYHPILRGKQAELLGY